MTKISKTWNTYERHDGYLMEWEKGEASEGHRATMMDSEGETVTFRWRGELDPQAGSKTSVVMVKSGVTTRADRPVLVLDHDRGFAYRELNAPPPRGTRPIMLSLTIWMLFALGISIVLDANAPTGFYFTVFTLVAAALMIWRLAIATSELRIDERARDRIRDEEKLCLEVMTSEWRLNADQVINMRRFEPETE